MSVYNLTAKNVTGPIFQTVDVLAHNFSTLSFNEMYTSQELKKALQSVIYFSKINNLAAVGIDLSRPKDTFFDNVNLKGYTRLGGVDETESANDSIFISGFSDYGKYNLKFLIQDLTGFLECIWQTLSGIIILWVVSIVILWYISK